MGCINKYIVPLIFASQNEQRQLNHEERINLQTYSDTLIQFKTNLDKAVAKCSVVEDSTENSVESDPTVYMNKNNYIEAVSLYNKAKGSVTKIQSNYESSSSEMNELQDHITRLKKLESQLTREFAAPENKRFRFFNSTKSDVLDEHPTNSSFQKFNI